MAADAFDFVRRSAPIVPVFLAVHDYMVSVAWVGGRSMQPTFNTRGERHNDAVLLDKYSAKTHRYQRGDVVVVRSPSKPNELLTKRVIGIGGDWIRTREGSRGVVQARTELSREDWPFACQPCSTAFSPARP